MNMSRRGFLTAVSLAAWFLLLTLPLGAKEKRGLVPESLPKILAEGAASLEQETAALKARAETFQENVKQTEKELQELRTQVVTLKTSLAVDQLEVSQAREALGGFAAKDKTLAAQIAEIRQKQDEIARQEEGRVSALDSLSQEIGRLEAAKHPVWRSPEVRQAYRRYQNLAKQYKAGVVRYQELLGKHLQNLEEERQVLVEANTQLQTYMERSWKDELLKRLTLESMQQRVEETWHTLTQLPERFIKYFTDLVRSGKAVAFLRAKPAPLLGLLVLFLVLAWAARRLRALALPYLAAWQTEAEERSLKAVLKTGEIVFSHLFALSVVSWLALTFATLGLWQTRGADILFTGLAVWVGWRIGLKLIEAVFAGKAREGILPLDKKTARFYRRHLEFLLTYVLLLSIFGMRTALALEVAPEGRQIMGVFFQVVLLFWVWWLLRSRYLDHLRRELPGPEWLRRRTFFLIIRTLVLLTLGAIILTSLLGFQNLSAYLTVASFLTGLALVFLWLFWEGARAVLKFSLHPDKGWMVQRFPRREVILRKYYNSVIGVAAALLVAGALVLILWFWGVQPSYVLKFFTWLTWGPALGPIHLTLLNLGLAALALYLGGWCSRFLRALLEARFYPRTTWDEGIRYTISTTLHYTILVVAVLMALNLLGVPFGNLALVAGGLGVGIGFGLQNIVNNFVSGLILLFERPIKVGDLLIIDGQWGTVKEIRLRSTIFQTSERSIIIIPNSELLSTKILSWTRYGWGVNRLTLKVGVSYHSDVRLVTRILDEVCRANPRVVAEPPPQIFFEAYGDSSLNFTIWVHLSTPNDRIPATHELNSAIFQAFQEQGIEIPFPQRDLHLKNWRRPMNLTPSPPERPV